MAQTSHLLIATLDNLLIKMGRIFTQKKIAKTKINKNNH